MVGWHHRLNGHEFEQTLEDNEGQRSLVCWSPWGHKEKDMTWRLNNTQESRIMSSPMVRVTVHCLFPNTGNFSFCSNFP